MKKNEFRTPLIQSAAVLGGVLVLFAIVASSEASSAGGGILAIIYGIGNLILFFIGMGIALVFSIALLIAIFLASVAMVDSEQASKMYSDLKKNFAQIALSLNKQYRETSIFDIGITKEEYDRMKQEIVDLQGKNLKFHGKIKELNNDNSLLQVVVNKLHAENSDLKENIEELSRAVEKLQGSERDIKSLVEKLTEKIQAGADPELKDQIKKLELLHRDTHHEIETLISRLEALESSINPPTKSGIFTYIEKEEDQSLLIQKVQEALTQDLTYAQIDDYLSDNLPPDLGKIVKDHPVLTKNYIRSLRTE